MDADHGSKKRLQAASTPSKALKKKAKVESKPAASSIHSAAAATREPLMLGFQSRAQAHASLAPSSLDLEASFTSAKALKKKKSD